MKFLTAIFAIMVMAVTSCTFQQKITFNEDLSGNVYYKIDASGMKALAMDEEGEEGEESESLFADEAFVESLEELEALDGISNVKVEEDEENGIYEFSYDFINLETLNSSMRAANILGDESGTSDHTYFALKGKKLTYKLPKPGPAEEGEEDEMAGMEGMEEMFKYEMVMEFAKPIKWVKAKSSATLSEDKKTITWNTSLTDITKQEIDPTMNIKL
jgi:hypothetical protein